MSKFLIISVVLVRLSQKSKAKKDDLVSDDFRPSTIFDVWLLPFPKYQKFSANAYLYTINIENGNPK